MKAMKSYLIVDDQIMEIYCDPRKAITLVDSEPQEKI
jgi:hypothetical protein